MRLRLDAIGLDASGLTQLGLALAHVWSCFSVSRRLKRRCIHEDTKFRNSAFAEKRALHGSSLVAAAVATGVRGGGLRPGLGLLRQARQRVAVHLAGKVVLGWCGRTAVEPYPDA